MDYSYQLQEQERDLKADRQKVRRYLTNRFALEALLSQIAEGTKLTEIAKKLNVPYTALYTVLTGSYPDQYKAARAAHTEYLAEQNLDLADKVADESVPPDVAKAAVGIRQWYMERTSNERWGQKSSVDVTHKGVVGLHLEAIRQLSQETVDGEYTEVEQGDADDIAGVVEDTLKDHPLL